jgi:uncharacterized membrane protein YoaK (UPF0700 family)
VEGTPASARDAVLVAGMLAFVAGFADASTFVGADGVFCAHVTGNFVVLAADLARHADRSEWLKLATFPVFVGAVLATTWLSASSRSPPEKRTVRAILAVMAALLGVAAVVGLAADGPGAPRTAVVVLLVVAMGAQNALHRLRPALGAMTTVMTGNVTSWFAGMLLPTGPGEVEKRRLLGLVIVLFAIGCVGGALGTARIGFVGLAAPALAALLARSRVR